ncbi:hypothetical protein BDZ94DRAFT_1257078 [Collybia nuda]|uniref:Uncharacterized protein n=1 Tax=Collybia nuda TaxID=64659 RepID=A0A9P5Y7I6_9AGAR|nr:hypothetical protein BDZ94DRAFT_1257078 [Collybia nuda]
MPALFDRLIKKSKSPLPNNRARVQHSRNPIPQDLASANLHVVQVDQRIHPDLNSLVEDIEPIRESFDTLDIPSDFTPLHPSPRRCTSSNNPRTSDVTDDEVIVSNVSPSPGTGVTSAFGFMDVSQTNDDTSRISTRELECSPSMGLKQSITRVNSEAKWSTFDRTKALGDFEELVDTSTTPATPRSTSKSEKSRTRNDASISTLESRSRSSAYDHENYTSASSPHTFGIPTPPSSGFAFVSRRRFHSSEKPPPLPPLDHPAFSAGPIMRPVGIIRVKPSFSTSLTGRGKTSRQQGQPRHTVSLPSFSYVSGNSVAIPGSSYRSRQRARTQSRIRVTGIFAGRSTPYQSSVGRNNPRHTRSQSRGNRDKRRKSAEFSAMQASSVSCGSGLAGGWEAQVSREMLRISLGGRWELPDFKMVAGAPELGPTRGDNVSLLFAWHDLPFVFTHLTPYLSYTILYPFLLFFRLRYIAS